MISDEHLYLAATTEFESDSLRAPALLAKCMALCEGSKERAKYMYINQRVEALREEEAEEQCRQAEIQAAKVQEQWSEYLDFVVQELKSINWFCSEKKNGKWVAFGPNGQVKTFKNSHELPSFYQGLSPNRKTETSSSSLFARALYGDLANQAPAISPKLPPTHAGSGLATAQPSIKGVGRDASEEQSIASKKELSPNTKTHPRINKFLWVVIFSIAVVVQAIQSNFMFALGTVSIWFIAGVVFSPVWWGVTKNNRELPWKWFDWLNVGAYIMVVLLILSVAINMYMSSKGIG